MAVGVARRKAPVQQSAGVHVVPAPIHGIDGQLNLASNSLDHCVYAYNMVPTEYGLRTRPGFRDYVVNVDNGSGLGVRTIIPFKAQTLPDANDRLFAINNEGIWDASVDGGVPTLVFTFADQTDAAGWGNFAHYVTDAGETLLFYADSANGLLEYVPGTDTWAVPTGITGVDVADINFVVTHKQRVWLVERGTTTAYYLPVGSTSGAATPFYFGAKFPRGGELVGLYNWTLDSGAGIDDRLVAVSRAGDVDIYEGEDPSQASTWRTIGTFWIGDVPEGTRVASEYGGALYLLSSFGLVSIEDLVKGNLVHGHTDQDSLTLSIARFIREAFEDTRDKLGWEIRFYPSDGIMWINSPTLQNGVDVQFRANLAVSGWGLWRGVPANTGDQWRGAFMIGTEDGRVLRMDVNVDNLTAANPEGDDIQWSFLTNYHDMGAPGLHKLGLQIKPNFLASQRPDFAAKFLYDFDPREPLGANGAAPYSAQAWDLSKWDQAVWQSAGGEPHFGMRGAGGIGRTMAVAIQGVSRVRTSFISADVHWRTGGPM